MLAVVNQMFQQVSGINLITYYAPVIYSGLGMSDFMARLLAAINGTEYFIASWPAVFLVERVGRRKLMLFGAAGQAMSMAILAGVNSDPTNSHAQVAAVAFLFIFNTFFAIGWLGMSTFLFPLSVFVFMLHYIPTFPLLHIIEILPEAKVASCISAKLHNVCSEIFAQICVC